MIIIAEMGMDARLSAAKEKGMPIIVLIIITSLSYATLTVGTSNCPVQFEGRVDEILESVETTSHFPLQSVVFKNVLSLKGNIQEKIVVEMLQNGPFEVEQGEEYRVQLRDNRLCWIEKI